jgi:hypothetical protein
LAQAQAVVVVMAAVVEPAVTKLQQDFLSQVHLL